ncbi:MAG TPA: hypothetical protein VHZ24_16670 [Pirellulales bacterium]|jgi:hypothetical protein|nr:hypothetical protein [Pirellulales bacterium]
MKTELWKLSLVKPYLNNPRINDDAVDPVVASTNEFGFRQSIVVISTAESSPGTRAERQSRT